jgi:hypothetical protein
MYLAPIWTIRIVRGTMRLLHYVLAALLLAAVAARGEPTPREDARPAPPAPTRAR